MQSNINTALRGYSDRIVNLHEQRDTLNGDIRSVYAEAKDAGFDTTTLREIVRELRMEPDARSARYDLLDQYRRALGMLADTPLGEAAIAGAAAEPPADPPPRRRGPGRPRKTAADRVDEAIAGARRHLGNGGATA